MKQGKGRVQYIPPPTPAEKKRIAEEEAKKNKGKK
jgi:hypothetical protein